MLKIHLFGTGEAHSGETPVAGFPGQQAGLLFCYLLLNRGQPQPRERLAAIFWRDLSTAAARKYLRNAVWRLKAMLSEAGIPADSVLITGAESVALQAAGSWWLDVADFEQAVADTQKTQPEALSSIQVRQLEDAAALYRGDLLEGIYEDWALYDRERLRIQYLAIRQKLMLHHSTYGRFEAALAHAAAILAIDPVREKIHRQVMRLHALTGDRSAALAQFNRCAQILHEELGLPPMQETQRLYQQIRDNEFDRDQPALETGPAADPAVLSRLHSLQRLADRLHSELRTLEKLLGRNALDTDSS